ncbi:mitochondrial tRNA-specific 2-thiouridylase 1 isoform X2 [Teleopsis dalmanni]|nr:mitochondrial tRNA-specific 2-thiouridylase 1 isoform X2 [Teleopsis dalmanni]
MFRNVAIAISGGVDSAVCAYLLKERGYKVIGLFMKNWDELDEAGKCSGEHDLVDAEYTCKKLNIELKRINYVKDYWNSVFASFLEDYQNGLTPNPDILCNKYIKFDVFYKYAIENLKLDAIATGHYAKTTFGSYLENYSYDGDVRLLIPTDEFKDQTFFLSGIKQSSLRRTMFPLGNFYKTEVKKLARKIGLNNLANKRESTGICFVGHRNFKNFIREYIPSEVGSFIDIDTGIIVGRHEGIHQWTIGQRCRLHSYLKPYFVAKKDVITNNIYVASGHDHQSLFSNEIVVTEINWICEDPLKLSPILNCLFRFQHTKPLVKCKVVGNLGDTNIKIYLKEPLRAITPGQYAVFYNYSKECLGSARIIKSFNTK